MNKIRAVIFDLYGTLIRMDNNRSYFNFMSEVVLEREQKKRIKYISLCEDFSSLEDFAFIASTRRDIDISKFKLEVENEINSVKLYDETLKTIDMLRQREINIGLISNLATPYKKPFFDFGLDKLVDEYLFSCEVGCKKPEEKIFKIMSNRLEVPFSEIIMIGDSLSSDFHGAIKAGMNAVLLDRKGIKNITPRIKSLDEIIRYIQKNF